MAMFLSTVLLAYLPYLSKDAAAAIDLFKETNIAVDSGYWPFLLDLDAFKNSLEQFLHHQNRLS
jgi:hypothetical protein